MTWPLKRRFAPSIVTLCFLGRLTLLAILIVILQDLLRTPGLTLPAVAKVVSNLSEKDQQELGKLFETLGLDKLPGIITKSYSDPMMDSLLSSLDNQSPFMKMHVLNLLALVVKQLHVPQPILQNRLIPQLMPLIRHQSANVDDKTADVSRYAQRVLWQIQVKELEDDHERKEFLKTYIGQTTDEFYYSFEAMAYLAQIGDDEAKAILMNALQSAKVHRLTHQIRTRLAESIEQIDIIQQTKTLTPTDQAQYLRERIKKYKDAPTTTKGNLFRWLIWRLEKMNHPAAIQVLKDIWKDEAYDSDYREEAQESLMRLGAIQSQERQLFSIH